MSYGRQLVNLNMVLSSVSGNRADFNTVSVSEKIKIMKRRHILMTCTMLLWKRMAQLFGRFGARSKFESKNKLLDVEGDSDAYIIADKFALSFSQCCSANNVTRAAELFADFTSMRENYCGSAPIVDNEFSVELVSNIILKLKRGKAAGLDSLTAEHLIHCHPSLPCILSKLFNLMLWYGYLPREFGQSYTVPLIKDSGCHTKSTLCSDSEALQ